MNDFHTEHLPNGEVLVTRMGDHPHTFKTIEDAHVYMGVEKLLKWVSPCGRYYAEIRFPPDIDPALDAETRPMRFCRTADDTPATELGSCIVYFGHHRLGSVSKISASVKVTLARAWQIGGPLIVSGSAWLVVV